MSKDRIVKVNIQDGVSYQIRIGKDTLFSLPDAIGALKACKSIALISDENVGPVYGKLVKARLLDAGYRVEDLLIPCGENSKSIEMAHDLWQALSQLGFNRNDLVCAVGGGVVGDLAGFVASTFMRGIDFIQVPTSLLAMVDASIGGKTGINLECGKNLVGTFHQPLYVCTDIRCLKTLDSQNWACGFAETIKSAIVAPRRSFYEWLRDNAAGLLSHDEHLLIDMVYNTAAFKASVVGDDAKEAGKRACLNYGHTLAHAIENATAYSAISHGQAVAEGMRFAARLAVEVLGSSPEFVSKQDALLDKFNLPALGFDLQPSLLLHIMKGDKKTRDGVVRFVLPRDFCDWVVMGVDDEIIAAHLGAWCEAKRRLLKNSRTKK